jgi:hypothetical protein
MPRSLKPKLSNATNAIHKMAINWSIAEECIYRLSQEEGGGASKTHINAFVLDDPQTKCRSAAVIRHMDRSANVVMCSSDINIRKYNSANAGLRAMCDMSTFVLEQLVTESVQIKNPILFDLIFLDYCRTPSLAAHNWHRDMELALSLRRRPTAPIYLTFSQRCIPHTVSFVKHSIEDRFPELTVSSVYQYKDRAPMAIYTILPKAVAFKHPPLSSYILPNTGDVVHVMTEGGWRGTVTRCVSSTLLEVRDSNSDNVYLVNMKDLTMFNLKGRVVPKKVGPRKRKPVDSSDSSDEKKEEAPRRKRASIPSDSDSSDSSDKEDDEAPRRKSARIKALVEVSGIMCTEPCHAQSVGAKRACTPRNDSKEEESSDESDDNDQYDQEDQEAAHNDHDDNAGGVGEVYLRCKKCDHHVVVKQAGPKKDPKGKKTYCSRCNKRWGKGVASHRQWECVSQAVAEASASSSRVVAFMVDGLRQRARDYVGAEKTLRNQFCELEEATNPLARTFFEAQIATVRTELWKAL